MNSDATPNQEAAIRRASAWSAALQRRDGDFAAVAPVARGDAQTRLVVVKPSPIHGLGGFVRDEIGAGTRIVEYVGERITKRESLRRCAVNNEFIFALDDEHDLDGSAAENLARFINHSCAPNCEARLEGGRIWVVSLRRIGAGEELTFNYGYDLADYREHPCRCGAPGCVGYIVAEELFEPVRRAQRSRTGERTDG